MRGRRTSWVGLLLIATMVFVVGVAACGSGTSSEPAPPGSSQPASALKRIVVGDLSVRVPAEWRSYDYSFGAGWKGVSLADPSHEPSDAVIFGFYSQEEPGMTAAEMGKALADSMRTERAAAVRGHLVTSDSGVRAYEVRYTFDQDGRTFTGLADALVISSRSRTRGYLVMYRAVASQAAHMSQFRASARSIENARSARRSAEDGGDHEPPSAGAEATSGDTMPGWSSDGRKLVFASDRGGRGARLYVIDAGGRDLRRLMVGPAGRFDDDVSVWSPDGRTIAFDSDRGGRFHLYVINANGSSLRRLTTSGSGDMVGDGDPAFSPDGRKIAFDSDRGGGPNQIYLMNADGTDQQPITHPPRSSSLFEGGIGDMEPAWSPDGHKIAFDSDRGGETGTFRIYVMNADGSDLRRLTSTQSGIGDGHPDWSPDGRKIAFDSDRGGGPNQIYVINADGSDQHRLTSTQSGEAGDGDPDWSPDGRQIAFDSDRSGKSHLYLMNADGRNQRPLTK